MSIERRFDAYWETGNFIICSQLIGVLLLLYCFADYLGKDGLGAPWASTRLQIAAADKQIKILEFEFICSLKACSRSVTN